MTKQSQTLSARLAAQLRARLASGRLRPGQRLSEASLAAEMGASRNSLREAFRLLTQEGLLIHEANRGVFVPVLADAAILDIYRARRLLECGAMRMAYPHHPAASRMADAVAQARESAAQSDWAGVAEANLAFHAAIVDFADSRRLAEAYRRMTAELGLAFALLPDGQSLHAPYIDINAELLDLVRADRIEEAALLLERYLMQSERTVLAARNAFAARPERGRKAGS